MIKPQGYGDYFWVDVHTYTHAHMHTCTHAHMHLRMRMQMIKPQGYGDYFWVDVVEKIEEMAETVNQYQAQSRRLPKALREWQAYLDCRRTIDEFLEMLPLFQVCVCVRACACV